MFMFFRFFVNFFFWVCKFCIWYWFFKFVWWNNDLDTSVVPPLIYAVMGTSREVAVGPVAVVSLLLFSMVQKLVDPAVDPVAYTKLVFLTTLFAGIFQTAFGLFRWKISTNILSNSVFIFLQFYFHQKKNSISYFFTLLSYH